MPLQAALLRGINVGRARRIAMPDLRAELARAGFADARTYVQSGNIVLASELAPGELAAAIESLLAERFDLPDVPVLIRSRNELAKVVALDPLRSVVTADKLYQVSFLSDALAPEVAEQLAGADVAPEVVAVQGREIYTWHPDGVHASKLARLLTDRRLGVTATARNCTTVATLLEMMDGA